VFILHPQLAKNTFYLGNFVLSRILLVNNANFPWIILVPEREFITDLTDISPSGRTLLMDESVIVMEVLKKLYISDRINMAFHSNDIAQFHLHIVARHRHDISWPDTVWGHDKPAVAYSIPARQAMTDMLTEAFDTYPNFSLMVDN